MADTRALARQALTELGGTFEAIDRDSADLVANELLSAGRIVCYGLGREGLMIRAFCMRLMHLGLDAHTAGNVTAPPIGPGDPSSLFSSLVRRPRRTRRTLLSTPIDDTRDDLKREISGD